MRFILLSFFLINAFTLDAEGIFEFSPNVESAYQLSLSLRLDEAREQLTYEKSQNPDNLLPLLIEDYIDFFTIFINEDKAEFDRLEYNKERRLQRIRAENTPISWQTKRRLVCFTPLSVRYPIITNG